jgi:hypothetical protein
MFNCLVAVTTPNDPWKYSALVVVGQDGKDTYKVAQVEPATLEVSKETRSIHKMRLTTIAPAPGAVRTQAAELYFKLFGTEMIYI